MTYDNHSVHFVLITQFTMFALFAVAAVAVFAAAGNFRRQICRHADVSDEKRAGVTFVLLWAAAGD